MLLRVKATPGASKTEALGVRDGRLRVRIAAAPEDGRANAALIAFLAKQLGCPKNRIAIVVGEKSRLKTLALPAAAEKKLLEIAGAPSAGRCPPSPPLA
jgi:uncharacterized protein (TIGR00251 family)